jgi:predicted transposase YdaD
MRANQEIMKEVLKMSNAGELTYEELLREVGFIDQWEARGKVQGIAIGEARGEERKALEIAGNMLAGGFSVEQTAQLAGLDLEKVRALANGS